MEYSVTVKGRKLPVAVSLKKMKQVRLKVFPSGEIKLSAPMGTPESWIKGHLISKTPWIEEKLELFVQTKAVEKEEHFISGASTRILGRQLTIQVHEAKRKQIIREDGVLHIYTVDRLYPIIEKHGLEKPSVCVKKMTTLWGSCSRKNQKVNLNYYLYKASVPCVEYVILHELAHFLYPYHNKDFYDFITIHMPDWQDRKKQLDYEFVLGI